jgi:hypothetical protein
VTESWSKRDSVVIFGFQASFLQAGRELRSERALNLDKILTCSRRSGSSIWLAIVYADAVSRIQIQLNTALGERDAYRGVSARGYAPISIFVLAMPEFDASCVVPPPGLICWEGFHYSAWFCCAPHDPQTSLSFPFLLDQVHKLIPAHVFSRMFVSPIVQALNPILSARQ